MDKVRCMIVDDEVIAQRIIGKYLNDLSGYEIVATCLNAIEAMKVLQEKEVDLMFLDIEMPKLKGLAFLKSLRNPPQVIITTAHREYALEGFDLEVLDYLLKPISFDRFFKAISKYERTNQHTIDTKIQANTGEDEFIYVTSERKTLKIRMNEIKYIEGLNNYVILHVQDQKHIVYSSITEIIKKLNAHFLRIHKSFVINRKFIRSFTKEVVEIAGKELPIGKSYKDIISEF